jgi:hypothetical protein
MKAMSKKNFNNTVNDAFQPKGVDLLIGGGTLPTPAEAQEETAVRATFIVEKELLQKIKDIAYWERLTQKDLMREAMEDLVNKYEDRTKQRK